MRSEGLSDVSQVLGPRVDSARTRLEGRLVSKGHRRRRRSSAVGFDFIELPQVELHSAIRELGQHFCEMGGRRGFRRPGTNTAMRSAVVEINVATAERALVWQGN